MVCTPSQASSSSITDLESDIFLQILTSRIKNSFTLLLYETELKMKIKIWTKQLFFLRRNLGCVAKYARRKWACSVWFLHHNTRITYDKGFTNKCKTKLIDSDYFVPTIGNSLSASLTRFIFCLKCTIGVLKGGNHAPQLYAARALSEAASKKWFQ